jgi:hypothetical protein
MSPILAFSQLLRVEPRTGRILLAGLAVVAVAAIAFAWGVDIYSAGIAGLYVVLLGVIILVIQSVIDDPRLKAILSWFFVCFFIASVLTLFVSVVFQDKGWLPSPKCLIHFWNDCPPRQEPSKSANQVRPTTTSSDETRNGQSKSTPTLAPVVPAPKPEPVIETRVFSNKSGSVNMGCGEVTQASVTFNAPSGFSIVSVDARWVDLSNAKNVSSAISSRTDSSATANGSISGQDRGLFGDCPGGGHGTLEIFGTIKGHSD